jgi:hypothetical protein
MAASLDAGLDCANFVESFRWTQAQPIAQGRELRMAGPQAF